RAKRVETQLVRADSNTNSNASYTRSKETYAAAFVIATCARATQKSSSEQLRASVESCVTRRTVSSRTCERRPSKSHRTQAHTQFSHLLGDCHRKQASSGAGSVTGVQTC